MKKFCLLLLTTVVSLNASSYSYVSSDFSNQPYIATKLANYETTDAKILLGKMIGDTIQITYSPKFSSYKTDNYRVEFELAQPDTIWLKQVKKPKLNKHYVMCLAYKGRQLEGVNYPNGSPFFRTSDLEAEPFVITQVMETDEVGRLRVALTSVSSGRKVIWHIENKCEVRNISLQNRVNNQLKMQQIYVGPKSDYSSKQYYKVTSSLATFNYDISASVYSYSSSAATNKVEDHSVISFAVQGLESSKNVFYYYVGSGAKSYASYKFVTKEVGDKYFADKAAADAKAALQAQEDEKMDSTFTFPVKLGYVHDEITDEPVDLEGRTGYVYGTTKGKIYGTDYLVYCNGVKMQLHSYELDDADADKKAFLERRGAKGLELREQLAVQKDKEQQEIDKAKAVAFAKTCNAKKAEFVNRQIFLIEHFYSTGEYHQCGLGVNIFNCFNKTIKYVEITVSAYNTFNDLQRDEIGNSSKGARCIGPIAPKETGYYLFNELFWNSNGVIHDCRATSIKITFVDNSTVSYSGWANIKKHYQEFFFDDRNPDYMK